MTDVAQIFAREFPVWHMVLRRTVVYWFLLLVFRFVLRRDVGSMGVADPGWISSASASQRSPKASCARAGSNPLRRCASRGSRAMAS